MKLRNCVILLALIAGACFLMPSPTRAQDTLTVQWLSGGNIIVDALYDAFAGDTINRPAGRVYKLLRGGYYTNTKTINNAGRPLRIVGATPSAVQDSFPPLIQMYRVGGVGVPRMFVVQDDLTLKYLWLTGSDDIGTQTSYQFIQVDGSGHRIVVDHCVFDRTNFAPIAFQGGANNVIYYTNNHFRDLLEDPSTQKYAGRGVSIWANQDTVVFENNTIFMAGFCAFQMESGAIKYLRFNHNTIVNVGRQPFIGSWWRSARFVNNLFVNPFWHGEDVSDYSASGRDPRAYNSGIFGIGPLPSVYGPEDGRSILFSNNAAYRDPLFGPTPGYYADSIRSQFWINRVTKEDFVDKYPGAVKVQDTTWIARPNFTYPDTLVPKMWANIEDLRHGITPATKYFFEMPSFGGAYLPTAVKWPLPENFTYSTPANILTAGTDGLPLGDLNWFPAQKATFLANYAANIQQINDIAPHPPSFTPVASLEAEVGTLGGGAVVSTFQGFGYFQMDGGGFFEWTFNVTTPGDRNLRVLTHMRGSDTRGEHVRINNVAIHDSSFGYGELIWSTNAGPNAGAINPNLGMPLNAWTWTKFDVSDIKMADRPALNLQAGSNTLRVSSSWGYQNFAEFQLVAGTDTIKLKAADATNYSIVTPRGEGAPWVPSSFKSVVMGTNGTVTWPINPASSGNYSVQLFYQNYGSAQTAAVALDGVTVVPSVTLDSKADSTGLNKLAYPPSFPVSAGAHTIRVTASGVNLDFIQLQVVTAVSPGSGLPEAFELRQNYPNPFNPSTQIEFVLGQTSDTRLIVYNILGQKVATLIDGRLVAGPHSVQFNARSLASGVYFYRLEAGAFTSNKKMLLLK